MPREIYISSDWHFGHTNFLNFKDVNGNKIRSFSSVEEMDEYMIEKHNSVVKDQDIFYSLGDVFMGPEEKADKILSRLKGHKRLILGNHDDGKSKVLHRHFEKIMLWRIFKEHNCVLSHVPLHESSLFKVTKNIHGHTHQMKIDDTRYINACVEHHDYTPISIEELTRGP